MIENLDHGQHVVLSFGKHESDLDYLFVSNLLTRRIRQVWESAPTISAAGTRVLRNPVRW
jgi:uncharacterized protein